MAFRVVWTDPALDQLRAAVEWIRLDQPLAAENFMEGLLKRVHQLRELPRSGAVHERMPGYEVRQITFKKY